MGRSTRGTCATVSSVSAISAASSRAVSSRKGFDLTVNDVDAPTPSRCSPPARNGRRAREALAAQVDAVITCLPSPAVSEHVLGAGVLDGAKPGLDLDRDEHQRPGHDPAAGRARRRARASRRWRRRSPAACIWPRRAKSPSSSAATTMSFETPSPRIRRRWASRSSMSARSAAPR